MRSARSTNSGYGDSMPSPAYKIRELKELFDLGALTKEEFDTKKRELLAQM